MENKQFKPLYKLLKKGKSNSGFTLIELLAGLVMSTIVVVGLGYGLLQLTQVTRDEAEKVTARTETSRAMTFIADEMRRAQTVEVDNSTSNINSVATSYNAPTQINTDTFPNTVRLALDIPGVPERIIYSVAQPDNNSQWTGPLAIYRWGPHFEDNGEYSNANDPSAWDNLVLIDGLDDSEQFVDCGTVEDVPYRGFFACIVDDDGDGVTEDGLTDNNEDGQLNFDDDDDIENDSIDDVDGVSVTAQLYFANGLEHGYNNENYQAKTQVLARARVSDPDQAEKAETDPVSFKTLGAEYSLGTIGGAECNGKSAWTMRTDFINDPNLGNDEAYTPRTWIHDPDRQGQQIHINTKHKLTISSIPFIPPADSGSCSGNILSRGNETGVDETSATHEKKGDGSDWTPIDDDDDPDNGYLYETSDFTIDFNKPETYNGFEGIDNPDPGADHVRIYKKGSTIEYIKDGQEITLDGYDDDSTGTPDDGEYSLGEFLAYKGYAVETATAGKYRLVTEDDLVNGDDNPVYNSVTNPDAAKKLFKLEDKERIVAVEIGQVEIGPMFEDGTTYNPGFDLQDNVFILSIDEFDPNPDD
ncbi:MAG: PilW family protein [Xenococcus sp. (in: cyanobacteria)]